MTNYWIHNRRFDLTWILLPPFVVAILILFFHNELEYLQEEFPFWIWLIIIVFIDVAHVYASLFRTYGVKSKWVKHKRLLIIVPIICLLCSLFLYQLGSAIFWSVLAYIAVFHFIRQQYGLVRLYSRKEISNKVDRIWDAIAIYNATLYPMLFWFTHPDRMFTWFMANEFIGFSFPFSDAIFKTIYLLVLSLYCIRQYLLIKQSKAFNLPKLMVILGTYISWYLGIVHFNTEIAFTLLNVISHGIPYIALVFCLDIEKASYSILKKKSNSWLNRGIIFLSILLAMAFVEEFLWERWVWQEHVEAFPIVLSEFWIVPLLALPQFTHYVLDAFIWRRSY